MAINRNRIFGIGVGLLLASFVVSKLLFFALPWAAGLGKLGRGIFRECMIILNLSIGYWLMPNPALKRQYLQMGIILELCFLCFVIMYACMPTPHEVVMQFQVIFRELLLSPIYFVLFYFTRVLSHGNQN